MHRTAPTRRGVLWPLVLPEARTSLPSLHCIDAGVLPGTKSATRTDCGVSNTAWPGARVKVGSIDHVDVDGDGRDGFSAGGSGSSGGQVLDVVTGAGATAEVACWVCGDGGVVTLESDRHLTEAAAVGLADLDRMPGSGAVRHCSVRKLRPPEISVSPVFGVGSVGAVARVPLGALVAIGGDTSCLLQHGGQVQEVVGHESGVAVGEVVVGAAGAGVEVGGARAYFADPTGVGLWGGLDP